MLSFYPKFIRTFDDLPGRLSLLVHAWNGCNMRCYGCHNFDELIAKKPAGHLSGDQVIERIAANQGLFDALLFSGGELLLNDLYRIVGFLERVRSVFNGKVVIFTNGTYPRKLQRLLADKLIDGAHVDMKLPYHCMDREADREVYEAVLGIVPSNLLRDRMLESVETVISHNSPVSQIRTVRYPLLSEEYFERIRIYVGELTKKHGSSVPYFLNPFHPPYSTMQPN